MRRYLKIYCLSESTRDMYTSEESRMCIEKMMKNQDSGFDLRFPSTVAMVNSSDIKQYIIDFDIIVHYMDETGKRLPFFLLPRSSTGLKTNMRQTNSMGLIDRHYNDNLKVVVDCLPSSTPFSYQRGDRYFQIASPDLDFTTTSIEFFCKDDLDVEEEKCRGGGFGSTGKR